MTDPAIEAAKKYLQGAGPWKLDEIGIGSDDPLVISFDQAITGERDMIIAWLRDCQSRHLANVRSGDHITQSRHHADSCQLIAAAIERGEHRAANDPLSVYPVF